MKMTLRIAVPISHSTCFSISTVNFKGFLKYFDKKKRLLIQNNIFFKKAIFFAEQ